MFAHFYHMHFDRLTVVGAEPQLTACFKRYIYLAYEFSACAAPAYSYERHAPSAYRQLYARLLIALYLLSHPA